MSTAPAREPASLSEADKARLADIGRMIAAGRVIPYLGPALIAGPECPVPVSPEALAMALHAKVAVSGRIRGNLWSTAQFIETRKHRKTLIELMKGFFATPVAPGPLHRWLASIAPPLIINTWYDGTLARAFREAGNDAFSEIQGATRSGEWREIWTKSYDAAGNEITEAVAATRRTILYAPHGAVTPAANFLVADSDYVEVLTEIDIQSPIPQVVKELRTTRGFLFIGCAFNDQMLRTYARQIAKRSAGGHVVVMDRPPIKNEAKFFAEIGAEVIVGPLDQVVAALGA